MRKLALVLVAVPLAIAVAVAGFIIVLGSRSPALRQECTTGTPASVTTSGAWTIPMGEAYTMGSKFGPRFHPILRYTRNHNGVDLSTKSDRAPILAASSGVVTVAQTVDNGGFGKYVRVDHGGDETTYGHLSAVHVKVGQQVTTGEQLGVEGSTGLSTAPHLHFEFHAGGKPVDPVKALEDRGLVWDGTPGGRVVPQASELAARTDSPSSSIVQVLPNPQGVDRSGRFTEQQWATARGLVAGGTRAGADVHGLLVMLVVLGQESDWGGHPGIWQPNGDGDVGPMQQRAKLGWYADGTTMAENVALLTDPEYAGSTFIAGHTVSAEAHAAARAAGTTPAGPVGYHIPGLHDIRGWRDMPLTRAAQAVQRSAFPNAYARHEATAAAVLARVGVNPQVGAQPADCTPDGGPDVPALVATLPDGAECPPTGLAAERRMHPNGLRFMRCVHQQFPELVLGGYRPSAIDKQGHPAGLAVDVMIPNYRSAEGIAKGDAVVAWTMANADVLGVEYVIWRQRSKRPGGDWRTMSDRGGDTANHMDHPHVTLKG